MSPIPRQAVKLTQRIRNSTLRNLTLSLIEDASQKPDLAQFTVAILKQAQYEPLFATEEQFKNNKAQTAHIYDDEQGRYTGHVLYQGRENKPSDE
ncbi:hypothetical protein N7512_005278 [Penicillium capsulatum]|nr:hypothetical protein N7512_005278 [Penicillium capsulatum]